MSLIWLLLESSAREWDKSEAGRRDDKLVRRSAEKDGLANEKAE